MNKIEKLINKLCPDGVEYKTIIQLCDINRGRTISKDYLRKNPGNYPVYSSQTENNGIFGYINSYDYDLESITWTTDGAKAGSVFYHNNEKFSITNICGLLKITNKDLIPKFLYYILKITAKSYVSPGMGNPKLMSNVMEQIPIPIPPISIQKKIVKILDKFTELEIELEKELKLRKKQYEYYRNQLLTPVEINSKWYLNSKEVELKELEQSGVNIFSGKNKKRDDKGKYNVYGSTGIIGKTNNYIYDKEQILIARVGSAGFVNIAKGKYDVSDNTLIVQIINENEIKFKFLYYLLIFLKLNQFAKGAAQPLITASQIKKLKIPVPPISEQNRIAIILDKFTELETELEKELKLRKKQYEYYREKLLTFKEKNV